MASNIASLLDKAKVIHKLPSDYKLALVMGVDHKSLRNYRDLKTLPDARVISSICGLTGDDPVLMIAEIEAERAKTDEARTLWRQVVQRLQAGIAAAIFSVVTLGALGVGFSTDAHAKPAPVLVLHPLYIVECLRVIVHRWRARFARYIRGFFLIASHV
jgi:hypothetical protein